MIDLENKSALEILKIMCDRRSEAVARDDFKNWYDTEYEVFFKALAKKTKGSMLWNERYELLEDYTPEDLIAEYGRDMAVQASKECVQTLIDQSTWLIEIGETRLAERWLDGIEDVIKFMIKISASLDRKTA